MEEKIFLCTGQIHIQRVHWPPVTGSICLASFLCLVFPLVGLLALCIVGQAISSDKPDTARSRLYVSQQICLFGIAVGIVVCLITFPDINHANEDYVDNYTDHYYYYDKVDYYEPMQLDQYYLLEEGYVDDYKDYIDDNNDPDINGYVEILEV